jgi:hypothetical protein
MVLASEKWFVHGEMGGKLALEESWHLYGVREGFVVWDTSKVFVVLNTSWFQLQLVIRKYWWRWLRVIAPVYSGKYPRKRLQDLWRLGYPRLLETTLASLMTEYQVVGR